jgi:predicted HTH domain antitoxin
MTVAIPAKIKERFLEEVLHLYSKGELSAGRAAEMLGISRAELYELFRERKIPLPETLNKSIQRELSTLE